MTPLIEKKLIKYLAVLYIVVQAMKSMTALAAMKQQKSNDEFRGLFSLEACYRPYFVVSRYR
jgi:hypothetical protein